MTEIPLPEGSIPIRADYWARAQDDFDPLTSPMHTWGWAVWRVWDRERKNWVCTLCGAPEEAMHANSCGISPIWAAMCAKFGDPLYLDPFTLLGPFIELTKLPIPDNPIFTVDSAGAEGFSPVGRLWELPDYEYHSRWSLESARAARMRPVSDVLAGIVDPALTLTYRREVPPRPRSRRGVRQDAQDARRAVRHLQRAATGFGAEFRR